MTVFSNLLHLYKKSGGLKTPMEDFCTECLAGVLNSDQEILNNFAHKVLELPQNQFYYLKTQQSYFNPDDIQSIVDIVVESEKTICLLEMKVYAREGHKQLQKYERLLKNLTENGLKDPQLRYCTLYHDSKEEFEGAHHFNQLRWVDIAKFLKIYSKKNQFVNEFYQFLKEKKMTGNERFTYEDLVGLKVYGEIHSKVNHVFNSVEKDLKDNFGNTSRGVSNSKQISQYGRLAIYCSNVIGDTWSEVLVSFDFNRNTPGEGPMIAVQFFVDGNNSSFNEIKKASEKFDQADFVTNLGVSGGQFRFVAPLAIFLEEEDQIPKITSWIRKHIQIIADFMNDYPDLGWN